MRLRDLLANMPVKVVEAEDSALEREIAGITKDSRDVREGYVFFATGTSKSFVKDALWRKAIAVVSDEALPGEAPCLVLTENVRSLLARAAAKFYGYPSEELFVTGVTGTNGKTTVTYLAESIVHASKKKAGVIGTISHRYDGSTFQASNTTPESAEIQSLLRSMRQRAIDHAIMEVSSHALDQGRVEEVEFDCAIFTNLTHDHLDYHGDFKSYREAKTLLFHRYLQQGRKEKRSAILNVDDPVAKALIPAPPIATMTYSTRVHADASPLFFDEDINGLALDLSLKGTKITVKSSLVGLFNVSNILAAALFGVAAGFPLDVVKEGIDSLPGVPGRLERIPNDRGIHVFVDYAHTPDALRKTIETLNRVRSGRLLVVFGCGGNRDKAKRPIMGRIASEMADFTVITSDNPRTEEPSTIIEEIGAGIKGNSFKAIEDRRTAIGEALRMARDGDALLVAGKGHEEYQIIGTTTHPFSDRAVIEECFDVVP